MPIRNLGRIVGAGPTLSVGVSDRWRILARGALSYGRRQIKRSPQSGARRPSVFRIEAGYVLRVSIRHVW